MPRGHFEDFSFLHKRSGTQPKGRNIYKKKMLVKCLLKSNFFATQSNRKIFFRLLLWRSQMFFSQKPSLPVYIKWLRFIYFISIEIFHRHCCLSAKSIVLSVNLCNIFPTYLCIYNPSFFMVDKMSKYKVNHSRCLCVCGWILY